MRKAVQKITMVFCFLFNSTLKGDIYGVRVFMLREQSKGVQYIY